MHTILYVLFAAGLHLMPLICLKRFPILMHCTAHWICWQMIYHQQHRMILTLQQPEVCVAYPFLFFFSSSLQDLFVAVICHSFRVFYHNCKQQCNLRLLPLGDHIQFTYVISSGFKLFTFCRISVTVGFLLIWANNCFDARVGWSAFLSHLWQDFLIQPPNLCHQQLLPNNM